MSTIVIPASNWTQHLATAIRESNDGDEIIVATDAARELAKRAIKRMCPDKDIRVTVQERAPWTQ